MRLPTTQKARPAGTMSCKSCSFYELTNMNKRAAMPPLSVCLSVCLSVNCGLYTSFCQLSLCIKHKFLVLCLDFVKNFSICIYQMDNRSFFVSNRFIAIFIPRREHPFGFRIREDTLTWTNESHKYYMSRQCFLVLTKNKESVKAG